MTAIDPSPVQSPAAAAGARTYLPSEALRNARALITPKGTWTQGCFARDVTGEPTASHGLDAVCWCAVGALNRANTLDPNTKQICIDILREATGDSVSCFNDSPDRTHAQVLDAFDTAIASAASEGR